MKLPKICIQRALIKSGPPVHLIWFVTGKCNLYCSHCFYHSELNRKKRELSIGECEKIIDKLSPLLSLSLTGGEPFLRNDLPEICRLFSRRDLTYNIQLYSNGIATDRIVTMTEEIIKTNPRINYSFSVSIDGFEEQHDKFRGIKGAFKKTHTTLVELQKMEKRFPNFEVGVGMTFHQGNQDVFIDLYKKISSDYNIIPGMTIIRGDVKKDRLKIIDIDKLRIVIDMIKKKRSGFAHKSLFQSIVNSRIKIGHELAYNILMSKKRMYDCYAGSLMSVIFEAGDVYPCEMLSDANMGNLRDYEYDLKSVWNSKKAEEIRKRIQSRKCFCTYECQYTANILYNIKFWPMLIRNILRPA